MGWAGAGLAGAGALGLAAGGGWTAGAALVAGALLAQPLLLDYRPLKVPAIMFHSVVGYRPDRPPAFSIWCPPAHFEAILRYLRWRGYRSITLDQLHAHVRDGSPLPDKPIALTFDDGYADNWIYAAPLLRKYGFTGTVFMPTDFIQREETPRPTLEDVWAGRLREEELAPYGYLNRAELRELAASGVLRIESHGKTHTWLPVSGRVIAFHRPGIGLRHLRWMWWNRHPERKPYWFHEIDETDIPWGAPVYENRLALSHRAARPDPGLERELTGLVAAEGGRAFFERPDWKARLERAVMEYRAGHGDPVEIESDEEFRQRLRDELAGSAAAIEQVTGRRPRFMSWPNGGTCREALDLLAECGYLAATVSSRGRQPKNVRGGRADQIGRVSATSYFRDVRYVKPWVLSFALKLERYRGNRYMEIPIKAIWLYRRFFPARGAAGMRPAGAQD
ncbi:MAG: hypothetical protein D6718_06750 [Acidobacteria bacterium]|nr:MAG: hypothetical protein D6718_06750 [Acidobacteriota bacterium]